MSQFTIKINGESHQVDVAPDRQFYLSMPTKTKLLGTKYGGGIGACCACHCYVDGVATRSCLLPVSFVGEGAITTIEGLSAKQDHPIQLAWLEHDVSQCGYCQSGQIMNAASLLNQNPDPTDSEIDIAMNGNICRCGTYIRIKAAIKTATNNS